MSRELRLDDLVEAYEQFANSRGDVTKFAIKPWWMPSVIKKATRWRLFCSLLRFS